MPTGKPTWHQKKPQTFPELFAAAVQLRRHRLGMSQKELGRLVLLSQTKIQSIESAKSPHLAMIEDIANALRVDPFELLAEAKALAEENAPTCPQKPVVPPRIRSYDLEAIERTCRTVEGVRRILGRITKHTRKQIDRYKERSLLGEFQEYNGGGMNRKEAGEQKTAR